MIHLLFNMFGLYILGGLLEPAIGRLRFGIIYFVSLLAGSFGALLLEPTAPTVGASGAIFGLMGAAVVVMRNRGINPMESGIGLWIGLNLLITFTIPNISIGGHIGGLIGGAVAAADHVRPAGPGAHARMIVPTLFAGAHRRRGGGGLDRGLGLARLAAARRRDPAARTTMRSELKRSGSAADLHRAPRRCARSAVRHRRGRHPGATSAPAFASRTNSASPPGRRRHHGHARRPTASRATCPSGSGPLRRDHHGVRGAEHHVHVLDEPEPHEAVLDAQRGRPAWSVELGGVIRPGHLIARHHPDRTRSSQCGASPARTRPGPSRR